MEAAGLLSVALHKKIAPIPLTVAFTNAKGPAFGCSHKVIQKAPTTPAPTQTDPAVWCKAALRGGTGLSPEAYRSLGCQATGDVGKAETFMNLKPTEVGIKHDMILWALMAL